MKVAVIFGTRPEVIKMAPVVKALERLRVDCFCVATAQHRELLDQLLGVFSLKPAYDLNVMQSNQNLAYVTSTVLNGMMSVYEREKPDIVVVQGDTTTTFAASLAAFYCKIPVGHVEAGLRTWDPFSPYPEEINRQLTTRLTAYHFAPTEWAKSNLLKEGVRNDSVYVTGNTVIDALTMIVDPSYRFEHEPLRSIDFDHKRVFLLTSHRRENFGQPMREVFAACRNLIEEYPDTELVYPVHPNPNVKAAAAEVLGNIPRVHLIDPLDYRTFAQLMNRCYLILTDSGGVQEEAPSLRKPVLVLRNTTERPEAIEAGTATLVGTDKFAIVNAVRRLMTDPSAYDAMTSGINPYGDGHAGERIAGILMAQGK